MALSQRDRTITGNLHVAKYGTLTIKQATEDLTLTGSDVTTTGLFPAGCIPIGATCTVTTAVTSGDGATSWAAGDGTNNDKWATGQAFTDGTTTDMEDCDGTAVTPSAAAQEVHIKPNSGTFSGGVIKVVGYYIDFTAPLDV